MGVKGINMKPVWTQSQQAVGQFWDQLRHGSSTSPYQLLLWKVKTAGDTKGNQAKGTRQKKTNRIMVNLNKCPGFHS